MNKSNKIAYMFLMGVIFMCCGCAGTKDTRMYLQAETQDESQIQDHSQIRDVPRTQETGSDSDTQEQTCFVYVCGAVRRPGVFELPRGSRVYEAIALAGGMRKNAYEKAINQAEPIEDGQMIEVLTVEEYENRNKQGWKQSTDVSDQTPDRTQQDGRIDINTATMEQLMTLQGIGQAKAANIIAYRESNGGFSAPEEIMNVSGIGEGVYAKIQDKITVIQS